MEEYQQYLEKASRLEDEGDMEGAIGVYNSAIEKYPQQIGGYYKLALLYHSLGKADEAIENFQRAGALYPNDASIFNNLGTLYYSKGMFNEAEESLRKAVRIDESYAEAFYGLARIRLKKYDSVGARSFLEKCLKIDPSFEKAAELMKTILKEADVQDRDKAKEQLIEEVTAMRRRIRELEAAAASQTQSGQGELSVMNYIINQVAILEPHVKQIYYDFKNRMLQKKLKNFGKNCRFYGSTIVACPERLSIGDNVHIMGGAFINAVGGVTIGDNAHISRNLTLYSYSHNYSGKALPYDDTAIEKPVVIGKNVWIGMDVKIIPGVTIGDGAIIGLGTVVSKDVPPLAIVGNQPPRIIKYRDEEHYNSLEEAEAYGGTDGVLLKKEA